MHLSGCRLLCLVKTETRLSRLSGGTDPSSRLLVPGPVTGGFGKRECAVLRWLKLPFWPKAVVLLCPELKGKQISTVVLLTPLSEKWQHIEPWAEITICTDNNINVMPSFKDHQGRKLNRASLSFHSCVKKLCLSLQPCSTPRGSSFLLLSTWWFIFLESRMALMTGLERLWGFILHLNILNAEARGD